MSDKNIKDVTIADFTNEAMRAYGTFVIEERAVADFRDGLKPVQRRIMYAAQHDVKLRSTGRFAKSAKLLGDTMGNYHPHGDAAIYGAMVNMVHLRYPLLEGHGNFGTLVDPPAAERYTECRLTKVSEKLFECLTVGAVTENYSGDKEEPLVLPSRAPFLLMNGSEGIAVGLSANIPPCNLGDLIKALKFVLKKGDKACRRAIAKLIPSPDFPFGGVLLSEHEEIEELYKTGHSSLRFRCEYHYESDKRGRRLVVTSFAPRFNISGFIAKCQEYVEKGMLEAVYDASSQQNGWRIVVEYKNAVPIRDHVLSLLHTSVPFIYYVTERLPNGKVKTTLKNMKDLLLEWLEYRREIETLMLKRERDELKLTASKHEAKLVAVQNWSVIAEAIAQDEMSVEELEAYLQEGLEITLEQVRYILKTELGVLRKTNEKEHEKQLAETKKQISRVEDDLKDIDGVISRELDALKPFVDARRTKIREDEPSLKKGSGSHMWAHVIADKGYVDYAAEVITRKARPYSYIVDATEGFSLVSQGGTVRHFSSLDDAQGDSTLRDIVGVSPIGKRAPVLFVANTDGKGAALLNPHKTQAEYTAFKTDFPLVFACGFGRGDRIWVRDSRRTHLNILTSRDMKPTQRGGVGKKTFRGRKKDLEYLHIPQGCWVLDDHGNEVDEDSYLNKERVFIAGPKDNYVVYADGKKDILGIDEVEDELKNGATFAWITPI